MGIINKVRIKKKRKPLFEYAFVRDFVVVLILLSLIMTILLLYLIAKNIGA